MDLRMGRAVGRLPPRSVVGYAASWAVYIAAAIVGFARVAQGHEAGLLVILAVVGSSIMGVVIGLLDIRAGRVEPPPGFVEVLRRHRRR